MVKILLCKNCGKKLNAENFPKGSVQVDGSSINFYAAPKTAKGTCSFCNVESEYSASDIIEE